MGSTGKTKKRWVRLDHRDGETANVMVSPENEDRFALTMELAIRGCKLGSRIDELDRQMGELFRTLHEWIRVHDQDIGQAYVVVTDTGMLFLVVQKDKKFNPDLEDELTKLDMEIAKNLDFNLIAFSVRALPLSDEETISGVSEPRSVNWSRGESTPGFASHPLFSHRRTTSFSQASLPPAPCL